MKTLNEFLFALGHLHDASVSRITFDLGSMLLEIHIEDIYWNFEGLSNYPGAKSGKISLHGVREVKVELNLAESLSIQQFSVHEGPNNFSKASASFWPSGIIEASFEKAEYPDLAELQGL